jgi:predicted RNA-binding Zn-ribbon protein involved in translation (DUF1610 family)
MVDEKPAGDEMYCSSCGEIIKEEAEICPECGVRKTSSKSVSSRDSADFQTSVSETWWYGVAAGTLIWTVFVAAAFVMPETWEPGSGVSLGILAAWFITPISVYFDTEYVRANSNWNPNIALWVILTIIWIANIPAGIAYLIRRNQSVK